MLTSVYVSVCVCVNDARVRVRQGVCTLGLLYARMCVRQNVCTLGCV